MLTINPAVAIKKICHSCLWRAGRNSRYMGRLGSFLGGGGVRSVRGRSLKEEGTGTGKGVWEEVGRKSRVRARETSGFAAEVTETQRGRDPSMVVQ